MKYITLFFSIVLFSCTSTKETTSNSKEISFKVIEKGTNGGFENPTTKVINSQAGFEDLWQKIWNRTSDKPQIPKIDFSKTQLILVAIGAKNNGGFGIEVEKITETKKELTLNYFETKAGEKCMTTQAIVFPFELIEIEKTSKNVVFNSSEKIVDCR